MLKNPEVVNEKYVCGKILGNHLIYKKHISPLAIKDGFYFFALTDELKGVLDGLPIWFKMLKDF
jgi:hypothetical protein